MKGTRKYVRLVTILPPMFALAENSGPPDITVKFQPLVQGFFMCLGIYPMALSDIHDKLIKVKMQQRNPVMF